MHVIKQLDHYLRILKHFNIKMQPVINGNYHILNVPANMSVFNKKVVFIALKKYKILNLSVLNSGGPYYSVPFRVATQ
jgi:hypothetical protein